MGLLDYVWRGPSPSLPTELGESKTSAPPVQRTQERLETGHMKSTVYQSWSSSAVSTANASRDTSNGSVADGYNGGYKINPWAYACAHKIARAASNVPWRVGRKRGRDTEILEEITPLEHLIENPNPTMSRQKMIETMVLHMLLGGNAILYEERTSPAQPPSELWTINPDYVTPLIDRTEWVKAYRVATPSNNVVQPGVKPAADIIHAMYVNPVNEYWGMAPYMVAAATVDSNNQAMDWNRLSYANRVNPDAIISTDKALSQIQHDKARERIYTDIQGASNAHRPALLSDGWKYQAINKTALEMDFIKGLQLSREDVCAVFEVPPPIAGDLTRGTYSNIETAWKIFYRVPVMGVLGALAGIFNQSLAPEFGPGLELIPAYEEVPELRTIDKGVAETVRIFHERGVPFDVLNKRFGLRFPTFEGSDRAFMQSSVTTTEDVVDGDP